MNKYKLNSPLSMEDIKKLKAGDFVLLSGIVYTARDAAHARICKAIEDNKDLPLPLKGQTIYYAGPSPAPPGKIIGSIGPTTSVRMDSFMDVMLKNGLAATIGKGNRSEHVKKAMQKYPSVYFAALGGCAALMASHIKKCEVVAYDDLGPESIKRLEIENLPLYVAIDMYGNDYFINGKQDYLKSL